MPHHSVCKAEVWRDETWGQAAIKVLISQGTRSAHSKTSAIG